MSSVSVIIPTFNGSERIKGLLAWLESNSNSFAEIIIIDDGSEPPVRDILSPFSSRIIYHYQTNRGRAAARNSGAVKASSDILWFLDDDMVPSNIDIESIDLHFREYPQSILVGGQFENPEACVSDFQRYKCYLSEKWQNQLGTVKTKLDKDYITAANLLIPAALFEKMGGFDETLSDLEDYDLARRRHEFDVDIFYDPKIHAWHLPPANIHTYVRRLKEYELVRRELTGLKPSIKGPLMKSGKWLERIEKEKLVWLPRWFRYKLYDRIIASQIVS